MTSHPTDTQPPIFDFKTVSKHTDAFGRQVKEAVLIRQMGTLNKRNEFAVNELVRMESKQYSWDESETWKENIRNETYREEC